MNRQARQLYPAIPCVFHVSLSLFLLSTSSAQTTNLPNRLPRQDLLLYRDRHGQTRPVKSRSDWLKRRAEILQGMQQIMGPLPGQEKRCPLDLAIEEETDCGSYLRRFITYASEPGSRVPAYLLIPKPALNGKKKFPAVLA